jgi:hypothetical protein
MAGFRLWPAAPPNSRWAPPDRSITGPDIALVASSVASLLDGGIALPMPGLLAG